MDIFYSKENGIDTFVKLSVRMLTSIKEVMFSETFTFDHLYVDYRTRILFSHFWGTDTYFVVKKSGIAPSSASLQLIEADHGILDPSFRPLIN